MRIFSSFNTWLRSLTNPLSARSLTCVIIITVLNIIVLIVIVCGAPGREINLMRGFQAKLANFLNFDMVSDGANDKVIKRLLNKILSLLSEACKDINFS